MLDGSGCLCEVGLKHPGQLSPSHAEEHASLLLREWAPGMAVPEARQHAREVSSIDLGFLAPANPSPAGATGSLPSFSLEGVLWMLSCQALLTASALQAWHDLGDGQKTGMLSSFFARFHHQLQQPLAVPGVAASVACDLPQLILQRIGAGRPLHMVHPTIPHNVWGILVVPP